VTLSALDVALVRHVDASSSSGVFVTDDALVIKRWNSWLERATGQAASATVDRPLFEVLPEIVARGLDGYFTAALRGEASLLSHRFHGHLIRIPTADGDMAQSARISPLVGDAGVVGVLVVIEDVSERVRTESELRRQIAAAEQARAIAEDAVRVKDDFLATLSHELRTPLNAVLGWTNILLGHTVEPEMLDRALQVIDRNAAAQARLIDDMLDMTRIVSGKLRLQIGPVDLVAAVLAAIDVVAPAAQAKNLRINRAVGTNPRLINGDADRIQQIAWNVLANAVKFTPPGGTIDVRIDDIPAEGVRLIIADSGKGISPDFLPHVFERFRQANSSVSRSEGGLGLGLALVRQLVEMHGGSIRVESEGLGRGTTFTITFPTASQEQAIVPARAPQPDRALDGYRILVVDDDYDWNELLRAAFAAHGADVLCAYDARRAFEVITAADPPDLMVADIGMAEEDGYTLMKRIRALRGRARRLAAVAVTAYGSPEDRERAIASGYDGWRAKPIRPESVVSAAIDALKQRSVPRRLRRARQLTE
jgi:PAS domain S-box-containing protein